MEVTAAFLGIVLAGFFLWPKIDSVFHDPVDVRLEIAEPSVSNPPDEYSTLSGEIDQRPETEPSITATVRNLGGETAWIEEARIKVLASARLNVCYSQGSGDVPRTKRYHTMLPAFPPAKPRVYKRDLHIEVQPGSGVRPLLSFQNGEGMTTNLYALEIQFVADPGDQVLDAGRFVISVPGPVNRFGATLPENDQILELASLGDRPYGAWCFQHNLLGVRRVIAEEGERSADTAALDHLSLASDWSALVDRRPARQVVPEMFATELPEAALYAVEAAQLDGDPDYAASVRDRAQALLLRLGSEQLDDFAQEAMRDAERALSLGPSPEAKDLLWRAKAAWRVEEQQLEEELAALEAE